jgi:hypothetical protein
MAPDGVAPVGGNQGGNCVPEVLKVEEVFKISGVPTHTFVEPSRFAALMVALRTPGRGLILEGPSGIGKSTAAVRALEGLGIDVNVTLLSARRLADLEYIQVLPELEPFGTVLVDDFHVLDDSMRARIADLLKTLADREEPGSKLIIVGINRAGDSLIKHAPDLANRLDTIRFEVEPDEKVAELIESGERALNVSIRARDRIIEGAQGSFYLAQLLCHEVCVQTGVLEQSPEPQVIETLYPTVRREVLERQERRFGEAIRKFVRGPKFRPSGRAPYLHILRWLTDAEKWAIDLQEEIRSHPTDRASVGQVVEKGYLARLTADPEISAILHYDGATSILSVEDPQLIFYLQSLDWPDFIRRIGFTRADVAEPYDFALSFAGEDRAFAERLKEHVEDHDATVFYDLNEQHRILAANLEQFLAPIYQANAAYVVAILGPRFGEKRWTNFESEQFKPRIEKGEVIPIWSTEALPTAFDQTRDIGGCTFDPRSDLDAQARAIAEICVRKLEDGRRAEE